MIEQSQGELSKLTQRNAAITAHLQQIQGQGQASPDDIRMAYDSALDAQQRLFVMRGQLDKLQSDRSHLEKYKVVLEHAGNGSPNAAASASSSGSKVGCTCIQIFVNAQDAERTL